MKRIGIICSILALVIALCLLSTSVSAAELKIGALSDDTNINVSSSGNIHIASTSKPNKFGNLSKKNYTADCQLVGPSWLYTNYYFKPNSKGIIYVRGEYYSMTGRPVNGLICAYDLTDQKIKSTQKLNKNKLTKTKINTTFKGLIKKHNYAIAFTITSNGWTIDPFCGKAVISYK
jgi:hypothetical protein